MKKIIVLTTTLFMLCSFVADKTVWTLDKMHAQLNFSATHFGISQIDGRFQNFTVTMNAEKADFSDAQLEMSADIKSINTEVEYRDKDLCSANWFDADQFPTLTFKSVSFTKVKGKMYKLKGYLSMHGVEKMVDFDASMNGNAITMTKKNTTGFTINGKINRSDFKIGNSTLLTGVGNEIKIWANVEIGKN